MSAMRPCIVCQTPTHGTRCSVCQHAYDQQHSKSYGRAHAQARKQLSKALPMLCAYGCGTLLTNDGPWVAAHVIDNDPTAGWVASCYRCNERAKASRVEERRRAS